MNISGYTPIQIQKNGQTQASEIDSQVFVKEANSDASLESIKAATKDNALDEIVVKDKAGKYHIIFADELRTDGEQLPWPSAKVKIDIPGLSGQELEVVHVDYGDHTPLINKPIVNSEKASLKETMTQVTKDLMSNLYTASRELRGIFGDIPQELLDRANVSRKDFDIAQNFAHLCGKVDKMQFTEETIAALKQQKAVYIRVKQALSAIKAEQYLSQNVQTFEPHKSIKME